MASKTRQERGALVECGRTADDIISAVERESEEKDLPCAAALEQLARLLERKDAMGTAGRKITAEMGMDLLRSWGWSGGRSRFDRLLRAKYKRGWAK